MNIYDEDLRFDPDKAAAEVRAQQFVSNAPMVKTTLAMIQTAALVDIADSLRTLAIESAVAMQGAGVFDRAGDDTATSAEADSFAILNAEPGTRVRFLRDYDGSYPIGTLSGDTGVSEGEAWAGVRWSEDDEPVRVWAKDLELIADESDLAGGEGFGDDPIEFGNEPGSVAEKLAEIGEKADALIAEATAEATVASDPDDLDDDFDGDRYPAADDALAALRAREKAAKGKKGKK